MRITPAHICNELDFLGSMLVGVVVGSAGTITQRVDGAVITTFPAINILTVCLIFDSGFCDTIFFSVLR